MSKVLHGTTSNQSPSAINIVRTSAEDEDDTGTRAECNKNNTTAGTLLCAPLFVMYGVVFQELEVVRPGSASYRPWPMAPEKKTNK